jgi:hypothetical protein
MSEVREWAGKSDGFLLTLNEVREATKEQRKETPAGHQLPPTPGENFGYMFYVNLRRIQ